jgi:hypothetical protein
MLAALLVAGCRDVLGIGGYGIFEPEAGIRDAGNGPRDADVKLDATIDAQPTPSPTPETGPTEPSTYTGKNGTVYASAVCGECIDMKCSAEASACASDLACRDLSACLALCMKSDKDCPARCNLSTRRTTPMSALTVCAALNCDACEAGHATYGGLYCQSCLNAEHPGVLAVFSRNFAALELDSCRQDCPPPYRDREHCPCSDIYGSAKSASVTDAGRPQVSSSSATDAGDAEEVLNALKSAAKSERCLPLCEDPRPQDWSCLDSLHAPGLPSDLQTFELNLKLIDLAGDAVAGARVRPCSGAVPDCSGDPPVPKDASATDSNGFAQLVFKRPVTGAGAPQFFGSIEVSWGEEDGGDPSSVLLYFIPLARNPTWTLRRLVSRGIADFNVKYVLGRYPDWKNTGGIVFSAVTCSGDPAVGVEAELDGVRADAGGASVFYSGEGSALDPMAHSTTTVGMGAFVNVSEMGHTLTLFHKDPESGMRKDIGVYPLYVRAGSITTVALAPYKGQIP